MPISPSDESLIEQTPMDLMDTCGRMRSLLAN
jgi:hypothetical protein